MKTKHEKCFFCKGEMELKKVTVDYWWKGSLTLIEKVPAWVCVQCGEEVFESRTVADMDQVALASKVKEMVSVPVKVFASELLPA